MTDDSPSRPSRQSMPEWRRTMRFWGRNIERDIDDELQFHLEMRERDFLARGLSDAEAREAALQRFGDMHEVANELRAHDINRQRRERRIELMEQLAQDIRYGVRKLLQAPGFTIAVVLVLALGIGVNTAIFSAVDNILLRPLPFRDADRLALLEGVNIPSRFAGRPARDKTMPDVHDVTAMQDVVTGLAAYAPGGLNLTGAGEPLRVRIALATPSLFPLLGARPAIGRGFVDAEGSPGGGNVVVLSHALWLRHFGGDSSAVGRSIALNGLPHTVVGVMSPSFSFPSDTELWLPLGIPFTWDGAGGEAIRSYLPSTILIRLADGVTTETVDRRVRALYQRYPEAATRLEPGPMVMPLQQTLVKNRRTALLVLMGAATFVLLVACANVTNLLLARAAARRRELAIRGALGASRSRIVQQLLTESVILSLLGGAAGVAVAYACLGVLTALLPAQLTGVVPLALDGRVLLFSIALSVITGLLFGLWPAVGATRRTATANMVLSGSYGATSREGRSMRRLFVVSEMAFALMLLIAAGLMFRSFTQLVNTDSGVQVDRVAMLELSLPESRYPKQALLMQFYDRLLERLRSTPGVEAAAAINEIPLRGEWGIGISVVVEGKTRDATADPVFPQYLRVTPDYFRTLGIRLLAGRPIEAQDDSLHPAAVVNKAFADKLFPGENPIGKRFALSPVPGQTPRYLTVVGMVADVRSQSLDMEPMPQMYLPFRDSPSSFAGLVVRGSIDDAALLTAVRTAVQRTDPEQATYNLQMLEQAVAQTMAPRRTNTLLIAAFGLLAVVLAAYGVYAVIAYGVTQRTREIGIRMALGARSADVLAMVLREGVLLAVAGIVIGLAGAWGLSRLMESMLFGVSARDLTTFVAAPVLLLSLALAAAFLPARKAARVDPMKTIRAE
ncbi:MAG: ABC transporter permease [Gemmatimonadota bacterium]